MPEEKKDFTTRPYRRSSVPSVSALDVGAGVSSSASENVSGLIRLEQKRSGFSKNFETFWHEKFAAGIIPG
jgi:hypothetical protein